MRAGGASRAQVLWLWLGVVVVCTGATVVGYAVADAAGDELKAGIDGFAAGALLVMLVDEMIPQASKKAGRTAGLVTTLGFAVAAGLSNLS
jgi:ZIP family zinc transporter